MMRLPEVGTKAFEGAVASFCMILVWLRSTELQPVSISCGSILWREENRSAGKKLSESDVDKPIIHPVYGPGWNQTWVTASVGANANRSATRLLNLFHILNSNLHVIYWVGISNNFRVGSWRDRFFKSIITYSNIIILKGIWEIFYTKVQR